MKINSIVNRYILGELAAPFVINLGFFTFIFLMTRTLEITNLIVNYRVDTISILLLLAYSMPFFLAFIIPMSVMMACLLTFLRMSHDNEITALKAGGMSLYNCLVPVFIFCLLGFLLTCWVTIYGMPWGKRSFNDIAIKMAEKNINAGIKERTFNDSFKGLMLYVNEIDKKTKDLIHVFVEEEKGANATASIVAPRGKLFGEPEKHIFHLVLFNGTINQVNLKKRSSNSASFDKYEINLDLKKSVDSALAKRKPVEEMSLGELRNFIHQKAAKKDSDYYSALLKLHEKFSLPFACFSLGLLALPLGLQSKTDKKSMGVVIGLILFLLYYILLSMGWSFGESGTYPPMVGMWLPNAIALAVGLFLFLKAAKDQPFEFGGIFYYPLFYLNKLLRAFKK